MNFFPKFVWLWEHHRNEPLPTRQGFHTCQYKLVIVFISNHNHSGLSITSECSVSSHAVHPPCPCNDREHSPSECATTIKSGIQYEISYSLRKVMASTPFAVSVHAGWLCDQRIPCLLHLSVSAENCPFWNENRKRLKRGACSKMFSKHRLSYCHHACKGTKNKSLS